MRTVNIYIKGKYDYYFKSNSWTYYLNYNEAILKRSGNNYGEGSNESALLYSLYNAIQAINEPCKLKIHTEYNLKFDRPKASKNKKLLSDIINSVIRAGHIIEIILDKEFNKVKTWEQVYGKHIENDSKTELKNSIPDKNDKSILKTYDWKQMYEDDDLGFNDKWLNGSGGY